MSCQQVAEELRCSERFGGQPHPAPPKGGKLQIDQGQGQAPFKSTLKPH